MHTTRSLPYGEVCLPYREAPWTETIWTETPQTDPHGQRTPSPVNRMTHRSKNITFPQLRLRAVKIHFLGGVGSWLDGGQVDQYGTLKMLHLCPLLFRIKQKRWVRADIPTVLGVMILHTLSQLGFFGCLPVCVDQSGFLHTISLKPSTSNLDVKCGCLEG